MTERGNIDENMLITFRDSDMDELTGFNNFTMPYNYLSLSSMNNAYPDSVFVVRQHLGKLMSHQNDV